MKSKYLTPDDFPTGRKRARTMTIRSVEREVIDDRPRLVLYFEGEERGLPLTRELADELTQVLGVSPMVEEFFRTEGAIH